MRIRGRPALVPALLLAGFFLAVYLLSGSSDLYQNGDTFLRYQTAASIFDHAHIWVDHPRWTDARMAEGLGGHLYAFYAPGQALFMLPLYIIGKVIAHHFSLPYDLTTLYTTRSLDLLLGAILCGVFFLMAVGLGYSRRVSAVLTLIFGLATPAWPDVQSGLEQTQVDLFLLVAIYSMWRYTRGGGSRWLMWAGTALGLTLFTRYDAVLFLPIVGLYPLLLGLARRSGRFWREVLTLSVSVVPWAAIVATWNWTRFGSPFLTGLHERTSGEPFWSGFLGLTVSPGKGILWYMPLIFLLPLTLRGFARRAGPFTILLAAVVVIPLLFYSLVLYWHGDPAWGPRYLYTALPYLVLPLGELLAGWQRRPIPLRGLVIALVAVSFVIQLAAVSVTQWRFWYRIEADQQRTAHIERWTGQPFHWGAQHYHYYWRLDQAPIPIQLDNAVQVVRLSLGDEKYRLTAQPDPYASNPAEFYPVNEVAFWWADTRAPLLGPHVRAVIAGTIALGGLIALLWLLRVLRTPPRRETTTRSLEAATAP